MKLNSKPQYDLQREADELILHRDSLQLLIDRNNVEIERLMQRIRQKKLAGLVKDKDDDEVKNLMRDREDLCNRLSRAQRRIVDFQSKYSGIRFMWGVS